MEMIDNVNKLDRLTNLPINVIHHIQDRIPIEDAARTSILSRPWRHIWDSNPKLVFDMKFCTKRLPSNTMDIISTILFQHRGSIKTFFVDISVMHSSLHLVVDQWMSFLSRNGIRDLTIQNKNNGNAPYKLPSYVYDMELQRLLLSNCIFRPPCSFRGFHKLERVQFTRVSFELEATTSSLWMSNLERVGFEWCIGLRSLNIYAQKLTTLCLFGCGNDTLILSPFMNSGEMRYFALASGEEVSLNRQDKVMKLTDLLSSWTNLSHLVLSRSVLKFFASCTGVESPPLRLTRLRYLHLLQYDFDSEDHIFTLLSILRSRPILMILQFQSMDERKKDEMEVYVNSFQLPDYRTQLNNLQILKMTRFRGSRNELFFISFVLASAPLLQKVIFLVDTSVNESQSLKISKELMMFPRASPNSEIIYEAQTIE